MKKKKIKTNLFIVTIKSVKNIQGLTKAMNLFIILSKMLNNVLQVKVQKIVFGNLKLLAKSMAKLLQMTIFD